MSSNDNTQATGAPTPALTRAVKQMLKPLVGLLLDNGLTYGWLTKVLKVIYVDVAEAEFSLQDKAQTDSRISLLTGVHRKDVRRLRSEDKDGFEPPSSIFLGAQLVAIWTTEPRFLDKSDKPAPLNRLPGAAKQDQSVSFEELVTLVSKDIRPRAILDEWLRLGAVSINQQDQVCLKIDAFIPARGFEEKAYYLGKNIHDHMAAARRNVQSDTPPFLERSVYYDQLSDNSVKKLALLSEQKAMEMLKALNAEARKMQKNDKRKENADRRMNFGVYFYDDK
ncbi:MAG: hypothetical protein GY726_12720 [Proteobacteria bacterium]|nr:hypothetical protein [Pseudomonadota bacterium]